MAKAYSLVRKSVRLKILLSVAMLLSGCAPSLGPMPVARSASDLASTASLAASTASLAAPTAQWPAEEWWRSYADPQLDALIAEARAGSPQVAAALARVRAADALAEQAGASLLPTITANGNVALEKDSYNTAIPAEFVPRGWNGTGRLSLSGSFDLDLWGSQPRRAGRGARGSAGCGGRRAAGADAALGECRRRLRGVGAALH